MRQRLSDGQRLLQQGSAELAITRHFDPIIDQLEHQFASDPRQVYSAHSPTEMFLYLGLAGAVDDKSETKRGSIVVDGAWSDALLLKGYALVELKRNAEAETVLKRATELSPLNPEPWTELGYVYQQAHDWDASLDAYGQAENAAELSLEGDAKKQALGRALRGQGFALTEAGKLDESEALYKKCVDIDPKDSKAKHELEYIRRLRAKPPNTGTL